MCESWPGHHGHKNLSLMEIWVQLESEGRAGLLYEWWNGLVKMRVAFAYVVS